MPSHTDLALDIQNLCNVQNTRFMAVPITGMDGVILEFGMSGKIPAVQFDAMYNKTSWDCYYIHGIAIDYRCNKLCVRFVRDSDTASFKPIVDAKTLDIKMDDVNANDEKAIIDTVRQGMQASADGLIPEVDIEERTADYQVYLSGLKRISHYALANSGMAWVYDFDKRELTCTVPKRNGRKRARTQ